MIHFTSLVFAAGLVTFIAIWHLSNYTPNVWLLDRNSDRTVKGIVRHFLRFKLKAYFFPPSSPKLDDKIDITVIAVSHYLS